LVNQLRHIAYAGGWKKFEPVWDWAIRIKKVTNFRPILEAILAGFHASSLDAEKLELPLPNE